MAKKKRPWSLLSSHGLVLVTVMRYGDLAVPEIAEKTGLSRSTVLTALKGLRNAKMLRVRRRIGRKNMYSIEDSANFRHPILKDVEVSALLEAFAPVED
jgi:DNA-binding transcriptional regulator GbsR (MarR family)